MCVHAMNQNEVVFSQCSQDLYNIVDDAQLALGHKEIGTAAHGQPR